MHRPSNISPQLQRLSRPHTQLSPPLLIINQQPCTTIISWQTSHSASQPSPRMHHAYFTTSVQPMILTNKLRISHLLTSSILFSSIPLSNCLSLSLSILQPPPAILLRTPLSPTPHYLSSYRSLHPSNHLLHSSPPYFSPPHSTHHSESLPSSSDLVCSKSVLYMTAGVYIRLGTMPANWHMANNTSGATMDYDIPVQSAQHDSMKGDMLPLVTQLSSSSRYYNANTWVSVALYSTLVFKSFLLYIRNTPL